jgi:alpha-glucosidase
MPWTSEGPAAGFSTSEQTWLPVDPAHRPLAVATQETDPDSTLQFVRRVIAFRAASSALRHGRAVARTMPPGVLGFERIADGERLLCLFELGGAMATVTVDGRAAPRLLMNGGAVSPSGVVSLPPYSGVLVGLPQESR